MRDLRQVARGVRVAMLAAGAIGTGVAGSIAYAQETLEEVVVTGTRIRTPGVIANSPIASVSAESIQLQQPINVEEIIKVLPGALPGIGSGTNNGNGGGATINLRGLGATRTLVLVDGRRIVPFDLNSQVDTNVIPVSLIERVDIVTGGASAVYGADAVSGVVNFLLKRDFEGVDLSYGIGSSEESDAKRQRVDLTMGTNTADGKGNVVISLGYTDTDQLLQGDRPFGLVSRNSVTGGADGSATAIPVVISAPLLGQINTTNGRIEAYNRPFNFNPQNFYVTPVERYQATMLGRYEINDNVEVYAQGMYTRSDVGTQLASSGTFLNSYLVPIGNPFIPQPAREQLCALPTVNIPLANCVAGNTQEVRMSLGRRITELGPRLNDFANKMFQYTVGVRGDITGSWAYDAYWQHGESDQIQTRGNWGSLSKVQQALRAVNTTTCISPANGCVPLNLFGPEGSITPAMVKFINLDALLTQSVQQDVFSASVSGDLGGFKSPFAESPIGVAVGVEYREVTAGNKSDSASQIQGEVLGTGAPLPDRSGSFDLKEAYIEALVPLISDAPLVHSLGLEAGYRHTEFTVASSQSYESYKVGLEWAPVETLRLRSMFQRATRAPNVNELFAPLVSGLANLAVDPCGGTAINAGQANSAGTLSNLCRLTGVPTAFIGSLPNPSAGQINVRSGGNPAIGPEEADTTTVGFVWTPAAINGLQVTFDYYQIDLEKAVSSPSAQDILNDCYLASRNPGLTFNSACALVLRSPFTGTFNGVDSPGVVTPISNLGKFEVKGYDLGANYSFPLENLGMDSKWGTLSIGLSANFADTWKFQATPNSLNRNCLGYYSTSCGQPLPETTWNQRTTWSFGAFDFSYNWRHIGKVVEEPAPGNPANFLPAYAKIDAYNYFDLTAAWQVNDMLRATLTIANATDEQPPEVGNTIGTTSTNSGNTYPQSYDVIGRYYTLGVSVKF